MSCDEYPETSQIQQCTLQGAPDGGFVQVSCQQIWEASPFNDLKLKTAPIISVPLHIQAFALIYLLRSTSCQSACVAQPKLKIKDVPIHIWSPAVTGQL